MSDGAGHFSVDISDMYLWADGSWTGAPSGTRVICGASLIIHYPQQKRDCKTEWSHCSVSQSVRQKEIQMRADAPSPSQRTHTGTNMLQTDEEAAAGVV